MEVVLTNCFFCRRTECPQAGIDGCWGDGCADDPVSLPDFESEDELENELENEDDTLFD